MQYKSNIGHTRELHRLTFIEYLVGNRLFTVNVKYGPLQYP